MLGACERQHGPGRKSPPRAKCWLNMLRMAKYRTERHPPGVRGNSLVRCQVIDNRGVDRPPRAMQTSRRNVKRGQLIAQ